MGDAKHGNAPPRAPWLFLSHSGSDTDEALQLKHLLERSPELAAAGLKVWFDKVDLLPGRPWQEQIERAIENHATAFAVYVGSRGVINWVEAEVRLGLSRAIGHADFLFIPILTKRAGESQKLPAFARSYHAVRDPLNDAQERRKLIQVLLAGPPGASAVGRIAADVPGVKNVRPYVGLRAMTEADAAWYFGREAECGQLLDRLRKQRLIAVVADSGAGKSSLVQAGLIPAFRGAVLADPDRKEPDDRTWHVVTMRPGTDPFASLREGITVACQQLGHGPALRQELRNLVSPADLDACRTAIQCDLPAATTETLLVVDQFEELLTQAAREQREHFAALLLALTQMPRCRVVLTVRADYFNLLGAHAPLTDALRADDNAGIFRLKSLTPEGIASIVHEPMKRAGHRDEAQRQALLVQIRRDLSDRPGDTALLQMALSEVWARHQINGGDLLRAYAELNGVSGALAKAADDVRLGLTAGEQALLFPVLVRLFRLGDVAGATRRRAELSEFDAERESLVRKLADEEHKRLLQVTEDTVELSHEALLVQWSWLQEQVTDQAIDIRRLSRLIGRATEWAAANATDKSGYLAREPELGIFAVLTRRHADWLDGTEAAFVEASVAEQRRHEEQQARHEQELREALDAAKQERDASLRSQSEYVTQFGRAALEAGDVGTALALAVEVLPDRLPEGDRPFVQSAAMLAREALLHLKEVAALCGHEGAVTRSRFSQDGRRVMTASEDGTARLWEAETGREVAVLRLCELAIRNEQQEAGGRAANLVGISRHLAEQGSHGDRAWISTISPDGLRALTTSRTGTVRVWETETGRELAVMHGHTDVVLRAVFSLDGRLIATASNDMTARIWEAGTGRELAVLHGHTRGVVSVAFSANGLRIVTGSEDHTARVWDAEIGQELAVLRDHIGIVFGVAISPDGRRVVTSCSPEPGRIWDAESGRELIKLGESSSDSVYLSADGRRVAAASGDETSLWELETGRKVCSVRGQAVGDAFSSDGQRILTVLNDHTVQVWETETGSEIALLCGHEGRIAHAAFSPDGRRIVTASADRTARIWEVEAFRDVAVLREARGQAFSSAVFSRDGRRVVMVCSDRTARVWEVDTGREVAVLRGHEGEISSAVSSPDGRLLLTTSWDGTVRISDAAAGRELVVLRGHRNTVESAAFSPTGGLVATASRDGTARLWETAGGSEVAALRGHEGTVAGVAFSPDGLQVVTAGWDGTARLWSAETGREVTMLRGHGSRISRVVFSSDGRQVLTASLDGTARLWEALSGREVAVLSGHESAVLCAAFSPDGCRVATASRDKTVRLWEAPSGRELLVLRGHEGSARHAVFSPDGQYVLTASGDRTARLWEVETGRPLAVLRGHGASVLSATYSPDGRRVATASLDGTVRLWRIWNGQELLDRACQLMPRPLTYAQREKFFLERDPKHPRCGRSPLK